jgi:hypothetical protein
VVWLELHPRLLPSARKQTRRIPPDSERWGSPYCMHTPRPILRLRVVVVIVLVVVVVIVVLVMVMFIIIFTVRLGPSRR